MAFWCIHVMNFLYVSVAGGEVLERMVKSFPVARPIALYDDCDWVDSPARPEYLY